MIDTIVGKGANGKSDSSNEEFNCMDSFQVKVAWPWLLAHMSISASLTSARVGGVHLGDPSLSMRVALMPSLKLGSRNSTAQRNKIRRGDDAQSGRKSSDLYTPPQPFFSFVNLYCT